METLLAQFREQTAQHMELCLDRIGRCLGLLTDAEVWERPGPHANSPANLILHLCGNITQYILSGLGGIADVRDRDAEFSTAGGFTRDELMERLSAVTREAVSIVRALDETGLVEIRRVQGVELSGTAVLVHVTEHYSYHTGQIALLTKLRKNTETGFYAGRDLNVRNA